MPSFAEKKETVTLSKYFIDIFRQLKIHSLDTLNQTLQLAKLRYFIEVSSQHLRALNIVGSVKAKKWKNMQKIAINIFKHPKTHL